MAASFSGRQPDMLSANDIVKEIVEACFLDSITEALFQPHPDTVTSTVVRVPRQYLQGCIYASTIDFRPSLGKLQVKVISKVSQTSCKTHLNYSPLLVMRDCWCSAELEPCWLSQCYCTRLASRAFGESRRRALSHVGTCGKSWCSHELIAFAS